MTSTRTPARPGAQTRTGVPSRGSGIRSAVVIEDEGDLRDLLTVTFEQQGFAVSPFADGDAGVEAIRRLRPDLITVDIGLSGIDGYEVVRRVREFHDGYVVMITGLGDENAAVRGFRSGADDFVTKPWRPHELRARIDALMRRPRVLQPLPEPAEPAWIEIDGLRLHAGSRRAELGDRPLDLTRSEFDMLLALLQPIGDVVEKAQMATMLRRNDDGDEVNSQELHAVEVHMMNLRRKLGADGRSGRWIETVRGLGYRFAHSEA